MENINDPIKFGEELTEKRYGLQCKVKLYRSSTKQGLKGGESEYEAILLVPQDTTQRTRFYMAWLPDAEGEHYEVPVFIKDPIYSPARCSIHRADHRNPTDHYLFVMSKGVEDILKRFVGKTVVVETFPASQDCEVDSAIDTESPIEIIE